MHVVLNRINVPVANLSFVHNSGGRSVTVHVRRRPFWFISVRSMWGVWGKSRFPGTSTPVVRTRTVQVSARYRIKYDSSGSPTPIAVRLARRQPAKCSGKNRTNVFLRLYPCTSADHKHAVRFWKIHVNYRTVFCNRIRFVVASKKKLRPAFYNLKPIDPCRFLLIRAFPDGLSKGCQFVRVSVTYSRRLLRINMINNVVPRRIVEAKENARKNVT